MKSIKRILAILFLVGLPVILTSPSAHSIITKPPEKAAVYNIFENCWFEGKRCGFLAYIGSASNKGSENFLGLDQLDMELYTTGIDFGKSAVNQPYMETTGNIYAVFTRLGADFTGETHHVIRIPPPNSGISCAETLPDGSPNPAFDDFSQCVPYDHAHFPAYIHGVVDYQYDDNGNRIPFPGDSTTATIKTDTVYDIMGVMTNPENPPAVFPKAISNWTKDGQTCKEVSATCFPGITTLISEGKLFGPFPLQYPRQKDGAMVNLVGRLPGVVGLIDRDLTPPQ